MTPKPVDLDELERLERSATKGEWKVGALLSSGGRAVRSDECATSILTTCTELNSKADAALIVALRNAAPAMIQELRELRQDVKTFQFDATLYRNRLADALAQADALRAELKEIKDDKSWNDGVIFDLRAEVEGLKAANTKAVAHATEEEALKWEAITRESERQGVIDSLRAQLATAHDALRLFEEGRKLFVDGLDDRAQDRFEQAADAIKTTKGGGT